MEIAMATTCFRPSQLPPNAGGSPGITSGGSVRKSSLKNNTTVTVAIVEPQPGITNSNLATKPPARVRKKSAAAQLSSTYRSFRDPVEEDEIQVLTSEDMEVKPIVSKNKSKASAPKLTLVRSHSEGDLSIAPQNLPLAPTSTLSKCLRVLSGSWKNLFQLGGMSRPPKPVAQVKKVAPPAVPDSGGGVFRHSGSSFGSAGYGSATEDQLPPPHPHSQYTQLHDTSAHIQRDGYDVTEMYAMSGKSPGGQFSYPAFTFPGPGQYTQVVHGNTKSAVYYHHQLSLQEDQGIDMTQSPGRDSPGSSGSGSRHSTASLDSGRASGCHLGPPHPRCSLSSSSVGSSEHGAPSRVERLLMQGVPDQDVLHSWLMDLHFEEYFPLFVAAGYDMHTISRMTPEDLTAIGIKKPNHRKKLKAEIGQLNISDGLPDYIPGSMGEWLRLLRLEEYGAALECQGYNTIEDVTQLTWEDLEDIGIVKLGHQKKIILALKRVKDLRAGKFPPQHIPTFIPHQELAADPINGPECECPCPRVHSSFRSFHQPWEIEATRNLYYTTDIVPIKIRGGRGKSLESLEEGMNSGGSGVTSFVPPMPPPAGWRPRSYDDGDITPTNEALPLHEGGGTLPRPRGLVRPRPIAKIPATFCPAYRPEELICGGGSGTLKRLPPSPPKRQSESLTVVADLHCVDQPPPPPAPSSNSSSPPWPSESQLIATLKAQGSDSSFKSSSSTESDSLPFANENAGTIKQRVARTGADYIPPASRAQQSSDQSVESSSVSRTSVRKPGQEPADVLNDIGNMLANLTDELDAMLEEEKRQGLNDD